MPKVSVVTPSYNHARFLPDRVNSILNQTFAGFEWIIIDDCSTDDSHEVLERLAAPDPRVKLFFNERNLGLAATTRLAIERSSGKYIYRAESDDACDPRFLEALVHVLDANPTVGFVYCRALTMDEDGRLWGGHLQAKQDFFSRGEEAFEKLVIRNAVCGGNVLYRRSSLDAVGGFGMAPFTVACDIHLNLRLCLAYEVAYVAQPLGYHRVHDSNFSSAPSKNIDLETLFRESYGLLNDIFDRIAPSQRLFQLRTPAMRELSKRRFASLYLSYFAHGHFAAAKAIREGVRKYDPGMLPTEWMIACVFAAGRRPLRAALNLPLAHKLRATALKHLS